MGRPSSLLSFLLFSFSPAFSSLGAQVLFSDQTAAAGIHWVHTNGATPKKFLIETMGGGGAFLDYDNDGWMDIYLVNSGFHAKSSISSLTSNALYHNNGDGTFSDVTHEAGVAGRGYGMGVAVGDYDNDGWADIYVTSFGRNILYHNRRDGTFEDVTAGARVAVNQWSSSAAFFDLDNDGDLDLFVCVYLDWNYDKNVYCGDQRQGYRSYCHPDYFPAIPSVLFLNNGDGTFTDVTKKAGVNIAGKALGVVTGDLNGDFLPDIYVANDAVANYLYLNRGGHRFEEAGLVAEVAYGVTVKPESGMGTDLGDFDEDGRADLIVTNIDYEMNNLYANQGEELFNDVTLSRGLGQVSLPYSGFGVKFVDYDLDGDLDLVVLNGHVIDNIDHYKSEIHYREPPLLLENRRGVFVNAGSRSGEIWKRKMVGRALAAGDYDNDGDSDLLFVNNGEPPVLLRNDGGNRNTWFGLRLVGVKGNRDGVGAVVTVTTNRRKLMRQRHGGGSYQAAHDPRLVVGLSKGEKVESIQIRWSGGALQTLEPPALRQYQTVREPSP
ncbi:MAG: CRTAC1 family protein [Acidobacteriota bacterium]